YFGLIKSDSWRMFPTTCACITHAPSYQHGSHERQYSEPHTFSIACPENGFMVVSQSGRLPAHTARFPPFPGLLHQYIHQSSPTSGVTLACIRTLWEGRVSLQRRPATRLWRAPVTHHSDPDKRCVWKDEQYCSDSDSPVCNAPQEFFHRLPLFSFRSDYS